MMMKYRPSRKSLKPNKDVALALLTFVITILISFIPFFRNVAVSSYSYSAWFVRNFTLSVFEKVVYPWKESGISDYSNTIKSAELKVLQQENENLKTMLGRRPSERAILARVLTKPPQSPYDELVIDVGKDFGVEPGSQIYDNNGALIGSVVSVSKNFSNIKLFSSPGHSLEVEMDKKGVILSIIGQGDGSFVVDVPRDFEIKVGDVFVLPGIKDKPIASVSYIKGTDTDSFKTVFARGFFEPRTLTWVFVESKSQ